MVGLVGSDWVQAGFPAMDLNHPEWAQGFSGTGVEWAQGLSGTGVELAQGLTLCRWSANVCSMIAGAGEAKEGARQRTILHADLDAFYASVEQRDNPKLRGIPMMVGGGVVLAASYEARRLGVKTAMSGNEARRLCPDVVEVPARMEAYSEASKAVFEIFRDITPEVEGLSIDEAFLDVTGLRNLVGPAPVIAATLRRRVLREVGLPISVGVASTKFLAKVASAVSKPDGLLVVQPGKELEFLHPLPVERLWGVGPVTATRLREHGLNTVAAVAGLEEQELVSILGRGSGHHLHAISNNRDPRRVDTGRRRRSIGSQRSFPRGGLDRNECEAILLEVVDRVTARMRKAERLGRTVVLRLRFGDFAQGTRSKTLPQATSSTSPIMLVARQLLDEVWPEAQKRGLTKVGISLTGLQDAHAVQLAFDFAGADFGKERPANLDATLDQIKERFGGKSIGRTALVKREERTVPLLPD